MKNLNNVIHIVPDDVSDKITKHYWIATDIFQLVLRRTSSTYTRISRIKNQIRTIVYP